MATFLFKRRENTDVYKSTAPIENNNDNFKEFNEV